MSEGWVWTIEELLQELVVCEVIKLSDWKDIEFFLVRLGFSLNSKVEKSV